MTSEHPIYLVANGDLYFEVAYAGGLQQAAALAAKCSCFDLLGIEVSVCVGESL